MITRKIGARGQITIPKQIREKKNIKKGDEFEVREEEDKLVLKKKVDKEELAEGYRRTAERDRKIAEEWSQVSKETNKYL
ncbi:MAG: AbrB/MazE/SpoVT family DNA-binding domain-containing protein [archaeon]